MDKEKKNAGSGQTPFIPELDSIVSVQSPTKPCVEESTDSVCWEIQEIMDEPVASGSKENPEKPSGSVSRVGMSSHKRRKSKYKSKITDSRVYSYDEIIKCQEKLYDSDDFQFSIDDIEKEF